MYQQQWHKRSALRVITAVLVVAAFLLAPKVSNAQDPLEGFVVPYGDYAGTVKIKVKLPFVDAEKYKFPNALIPFSFINVALDELLKELFTVSGSECLEPPSNGDAGNVGTQPEPNFAGVILSSERTTAYALDVESLVEFMGPYIETVLCNEQGIAALVGGNGEGEVWAQGLQYPYPATSVHVDVDLEFVVNSPDGEEIGKAAVEIQFSGEFAG